MLEQAEGKEQCCGRSNATAPCARGTATGAVHPLAKDVEFTQGLDDRIAYYTAAKKNPHWLCRHCGSVLVTDLTWLMENMFEMEPRYTVNVSTVGLHPRS